MPRPRVIRNMATHNDILLDDNADLLIEKGDLVVADSLNQQVGFLLLFNKGEVKQHPLTGVGLAGMINDESMNEVTREVRKQLKDDGIKLEKIKMENGKLYLKANYE